MAKILSVFNSRLYALLSLVVIAGLVVSQAHMMSRINNLASNKILAFEEGADDQKASSESESNYANQVGVPPPPYDPSLFPTADCSYKAFLTEPTSNTYNPDVPYNLDFFSGPKTAVFQDINGDNLPDYVMSQNTIDGANWNSQNYEACVYLNNGNGWTKAYVCRAFTRINLEAEQILQAEYKGDCAGEPSAKSSGNE